MAEFHSGLLLTMVFIFTNSIDRSLSTPANIADEWWEITITTTTIAPKTTMTDSEEWYHKDRTTVSAPGGKSSAASISEMGKNREARKLINPGQRAINLTGKIGFGVKGNGSSITNSSVNLTGKEGSWGGGTASLNKINNSPGSSAKELASPRKKAVFPEANLKVWLWDLYEAKRGSSSRSEVGSLTIRSVLANKVGNQEGKVDLAGQCFRGSASSEIKLAPMAAEQVKGAKSAGARRIQKEMKFSVRERA